jgi:uncharacterized membrane protein
MDSPERSAQTMMEQMTTSSLTFRKVIPDVLAGLAVFVLIVGLSCGATSVSASESTSIFGSHVSHRETVILLASGLAAMVALNVAVFRHLIRAYVAPRRAAYRRALKSDGFGGS